MELKEKSFPVKVCVAFSKLTMIIEFMRKQESQLYEHLFMSPDLCIGVADTLQIVKEEVYRIVSDAQAEINRLKGKNNNAVDL